MNVDELQLHLSNLGHLLRDAGGTKTAAALEEFCRSLQPYRDRRLKDLMELVARAEEIVRTGTPPPRAKTPSRAKKDPLLLERLGNRVVELYQNAKQPETTREQIENAFNELTAADPTVPKLQELARRMDISQKFRAKKDLLEYMKRAVLERKGVFERVQV